MIDKDNLEEIVLFEFLSDAEKENLSKFMGKKSFYKGDLIFSENTSGGILYVVKSGEVKTSKVIREGERQTLGILGVGEHFGSISLIDGQEHSATAEVLSDCTVLTLEKKDFDVFAEEFPAASLKILKAVIVSLCSFLRDMNKKFVDMVHYITRDR